MNGSSKNNDDIIDDFTNFGVSVRSFLRARPKAGTAHRLAIFDAVLNSVESIHADEMAAKDDIHATELVGGEKEINDWKEKAAEDATTIGKLQADKKKWTAEKEQKDEALAAAKQQAAEDAAKIGKLQADKEEWTAELKQKDTEMVAMKTENEVLVAAKHEDNKWKKKCQSLEKKLEGQLEAFAEEKKIARDNMKQRHEEELERSTERAKLAVKDAVASAVGEKDEEIEELTRVNKLLRDYRRKSEGSTISNLPSA